MKKLISMLLAIIMAMSVVSVSAEVDTEGYNTVPLYEDTSTSGFTANTNGELSVSNGEYTLKKKTDAGSKMACAELNSGLNLTTYKYLKVTMDVKVNKSCNKAAIAAYTTTGSNRSNLLAFSNVGGDFLENAEYTVNDWNTVTLYLDYSDTVKKVVGYVNDNLAANKDVPSSPVSLTTFRIVLDASTAGDVEISFRNFKIFALENPVEPTVAEGETTTTYTSEFKDDFTYEGVSVGSSLNNAETGFPAKYIVTSGTGLRRHKAKDLENDTNYVLEYSSSSSATDPAKILIQATQITAKNFETNDSIYFSYRFYPTADMNRTTYIYPTTEGNRKAFIKFLKDRNVEIRYGNSSDYANIGKYNLNAWNTILVKFTKTSNGNYTYVAKLNDTTTDSKAFAVQNIYRFGIFDNEKVDDVMYIDDIEIGTWSTETEPDIVTAYPDRVLRQGDDYALIFSTYVVSDDVKTLVPVVAAYSIEGTSKTLLSINVMDKIENISTDTLGIKGAVNTGEANEYKIFFLQDVDDTLKPLAQSKVMQ